MVLNPKPFPSIRKPAIRSRALSTKNEYDTGMPVAKYIMVHNPVPPPLAIPFGIRKDVQPMQYTTVPNVTKM